MSLTRRQVALQRLRRDVELSRLELSDREWRVLLSILASLVARETSRDIEREWRRAA